MMKSILAFESVHECSKHEELTKRLIKRLQAYEELLKDDYQLNSVPKAVVWTNNELATNVFSSIPIPAYTREDFIYLSPELNVWQKLMIQQLDDKEVPIVRSYYETFSEDHLLEILAHELTHHIDLFMDEFDDIREDSIWFEEGMCFYLPRLHLFDKEHFNTITKIEEELVEAFKNDYGQHSLDNFGTASYAGSLSSIMFDYWRSYLKVKELVDFYDGNVHKLFEIYHNWDKDGRTIPLSQYFNLGLNTK
jgi:hypothetical protein